MDDFVVPAHQRAFRCNHCNGRILIPKDLPPTTGPCPLCSGVITSPAPEVAPPSLHTAMPSAPAPVAPALPVAPVAPAQTAPLPAIAPAPIPASIPAAPAPIPPLTQQPAPAPAMPAQPAYAQAPPTQQAPPSLQTSQPAAAATPAVTPPPQTVAPQAESQNVRHEPAPVASQPVAPSPPVQPQEATKGSKTTPSPRSGLLMVILIFVLLLILGGAGVFFAMKELGKKPAPVIPKVSEGNPEAVETQYINIGWQKDAYEVLSGYLAATTTEGKLAYILNAEALKPKVEEFYGGGVINDSDTPAESFAIYDLLEEDRRKGLFMMIYDQPPQFALKEFFTPLASLEVQHGVEKEDLLLRNMAGIRNFAMEPLRVHAFFKRTPQGLKLDWEIFVQTKYRTFQNFVELPDPGNAQIFRVFIEEDVPEKGRAIPGMLTYRLKDPANSTDIARVNVKVDSEPGRALSVINWRGSSENRPINRNATLELKWTNDASSPELEISRFICWEFLGLGGQDEPAPESK